MGIDTIAAPAIVATLLVAWCAIAIALVRRAERRVGVTRSSATWAVFALGTGVALLAVALRPGLAGAACGVACIALIVAGGADARTGFIFDAITLPAAVLAATLAIASGASGLAAWGVALLVGAFGAVVVFSRGRYMGLGDIKAMYAIGAAFGPFESLVAIFAACASGIIAVAIAGRFARGAEVRFGPHLAIGATFALVVGDPIVHRSLGL